MTKSQPTIFPGWWVVVAAAAGLAVHYGPIVTMSFGVFLKPLSTEFGWNRSQISLAFSFSVVALALAQPLFGQLVDRYGARRIIVPSATLFGLCLVQFYWLSDSIWHLYLSFILIGIFGAGNTPVSFCKVVAHWFDKHRGLAIALAVSGSSLSTLVVPVLAQTMIEHAGWRLAYAYFGVAVIVVTIPVVGLFLKESPAQVGLRPYGTSPTSTTPVGAPVAGATFTEAVRTRLFWLLITSFFLVSVGFHGCLLHLFPLLTDRGFSGTEAALATTVVGAGIIVGRLITGVLLDRFFAPYVAMALFLLATLGIAILILGLGGNWVFVAAALIGMAEGAELDIMPFMVSRYFGLRTLGTIYSFAFSGFLLGGVVGPLVMARSFDATQSYQTALAWLAGTVVVSGLLLLLLGPYRYHQES